MRLDKLIALSLPHLSRNHIQQAIKNGQTTVGINTVTRSNHLVRSTEPIHITMTQVTAQPYAAQAIPLTLVFEDDALLVINKPAGLVVHPGAGNWDHTLVNGLLHRYPDLEQLPRAGLIHRLDKDTSGLLLIAKTNTTFQHLTTAMSQRRIHRSYHAICEGIITPQTINQPIGRHPVQRTKMAIRSQGKPATTHIKAIRHFAAHTLVEATLETGRTHQIRVHLNHIGHAIVGDPTYGRARRWRHYPEPQASFIREFPRQALHAHQLAFQHPISQQQLALTCPIPSDIETLIHHLTTDPML